MLQNTPSGEREQNTIEIVDQLNLGRSLICRQSDQDELAELNLTAGKMAKASAAYEQAFMYLKTGKDMLTEDCWQRHYELTLALDIETAEAAYLSGDFEQTERIAQTALQHVSDLLDRVKIYEIMTKAYIAQNKPKEAIKISLNVLKLLGISLPEKPDKLQILLAVINIKLTLARKKIDELLNRPKMTDPYMLAALRILTLTNASAYLSSHNLMALITLKGISISVKHGNAPVSASFYASYGGLLCGILGEIDRGYLFGQLALNVIKQFSTQEFKARTMLVDYLFIIHWKKHARETVRLVSESYKIGLETGDFEYAAYSASAEVAYSLFIGKELSELENKLYSYQNAIQKINQEMIIGHIKMYRQTVLNLTDQAEDPCRLTGEACNEELILSTVLKAKDKYGIFFSYFLRLILCYLFHKYSQAVTFSTKAQKAIEGVIGMLHISIFYFYDSLARLAVFSDSPKPERKRILKKVAKNQKKMKKWADHAPMNFLHKFYLVEAERYRVTGKDHKAADSYDQAVELAKVNEYINEEALANELAGKFYLDKNKENIARTYLQEARYCYLRWGAKAKVRDIDERYQYLFRTKSEISGYQTIHTPRSLSATTSGSPTSVALDLKTVMKASQTISGEIVLDNLLVKLMQIIIENAGAENGFLLLPKQGNWFIEAQGHLDSSDTTVLQSIPLEEIELVSAGIIHYVTNTQENVVLHDAANEGLFTLDIHIVKHRPKSVLCAPLINLGKLTGILYLENNLTVGAFTPERLEVLNLLLSQIAISIENSFLYSNLEERVAERTSELEHEIVVRKRAEEAAETANRTKSAFLASMSHELRTPLNGILGFAQILQRDPSVTAQQQHGLNVIEQSGNHLLALINDVLDLAKVESGKIDLYETDFNLPSLLSGVSEIINIRAEHKGIDYYLESANDLPDAVHGDDRRLRQILLNLLGNAVKFTDHGSVTLKVSVNWGERTNSPLFCFKIKDTGVGISPENCESIFEPFEQVGEQERQVKGTGLGLAISKNLVELMGGRLYVSSLINAGTQFWFELALPIVDYNVTQVTQQPIIGVQGEPPEILIVDDNSVSQGVLADLLSPLGFNIKLANDGREGLEKALKWQPDVIITDLIMPETDGFELIRQLRQSPVLKEKIIIAASASVYEKDKSIAVGSNAFLPKPIQTETLLEQLRSHLNLTWVYRENIKETAVENNISQPMVFPPASELEKLYELSLMGDIEELEEWAAILADTDVKLKPFVTQMQIFLKKYLVDELGEWLEGEMVDD